MKFFIVVLATVFALVSNTFGQLRRIRDRINAKRNQRLEERLNLSDDYVGTLFYDATMKLNSSKYFRNTIISIAEQLNDFENDMLDINHKRVKLDKTKFTKDEKIELGKLFENFGTAAPRLRESLLEFINNFKSIQSVMQIPTILTKEMKDATIDLMKLIKEITKRRILPSEFIPRTTRFFKEMKLPKAIIADIRSSNRKFFKMLVKLTIPDFSKFLFD